MLCSSDSLGVVGGAWVGGTYSAFEQDEFQLACGEYRNFGEIMRFVQVYIHRKYLQSRQHTVAHRAWRISLLHRRHKSHLLHNRWLPTWTTRHWHSVRPGCCSSRCMPNFPNRSGSFQMPHKHWVQWSLAHSWPHKGHRCWCKPHRCHSSSVHIAYYLSIS